MIRFSPLPSLLLMLLLSGPLLADAPRVVVTITPLHSLVAGVMAGVAEPELLFSGGQSPHTLVLRPSDARSLEQADLLFWAGPALETALSRVLVTTARGAQVVALMEAAGVELLPVRSGGGWESHHHAADAAGHHHHHPAPTASGQEYDPHIWLSPKNARAMVVAIGEALGALDSVNAARYTANAEALLARIDALDQQLAVRTAALREYPFVVFHDAYQYLEHHYRLNAVGSVTLNPEQPPGARRLHQLRQRIADLEVVCIFSEPQFEPRLVQVLVAGSAVRSAELDPLGSAVTPGPDAWFAVMEGLVTTLAECLDPPSAPSVQHTNSKDVFSLSMTTEKHHNLFGSVGYKGKVRNVGLEGRDG